MIRYETKPENPTHYFGISKSDELDSRGTMFSGEDLGASDNPFYVLPSPMSSTARGNGFQVIFGGINQVKNKGLVKVNLNQYELLIVEQDENCRSLSSFIFESQRRSSTEHVSHARRVLNNLYSLLANQHDQQAIEVAFEFIESEFSAGNTSSVDEALLSISVEKVSTSLLVGILRATSRAQSVLPSWGLLLQRTQECLESKGGDSKRALRGLLKRVC